MKTILIADHSLFSRSIIKKLLAKSEYRVISEADDGKEAVRKYFHLHPDFVLMDYAMPKMNGIDALKEIMRINPRANVIMFSSLDSRVFIDESLDFGAKNFLVKPSFQGLIPALDRIEVSAS